MKSLPYLLLLCLAAAQTAPAQEFAWHPPGSRPNAMGTAFSTVSRDPYAVFYNPANLTTLSNLEYRFDTARRLSPGTGTGEVSMVYVRPHPDKVSLVAGAGLHSTRRGPYSTDTLLLSFGERTVIKHFQQPIYYGGGLRIASARSDTGGRLGLGVDAGVQVAANSGLRTAVVVSNLLYGMGEIPAILTIGNSYPVLGATLLADFRIRSGYSELFFGAEYPVFNGLVQLRGGKGSTLDRGDYIALGLGINTLPWVIDFTWSLPVSGLQEKAGYYGFTAGYRFGASSFSGNLVGDASRKVEELRNQAADLRLQRGALESAIAAYTVNKNTLQTDLAMLKIRARELEENIRELEARERQAEYLKENPKQAKRYVPPAPVKWPKRHTVQAGETLRSISSRYYGTPSLWEKIYQANEKLVFKGLPVEGSVFTIPPPPAGSR